MVLAGEGDCEPSLLCQVRGARELERDEAGEHRAEAHDDAIDGLRGRDEVANVELDVGQHRGRRHRQSHGRLGKQLHKTMGR